MRPVKTGLSRITAVAVAALVPTGDNFDRNRINPVFNKANRVILGIGYIERRPGARHSLWLPKRGVLGRPIDQRRLTAAERAPNRSVEVRLDDRAGAGRGTSRDTDVVRSGPAGRRLPSRPPVGCHPPHPSTAPQPG